MNKDGYGYFKKCETCIHENVCKDKEDFKKLNEEILEFVKNKELSDFYIKVNCRNFTSKYKTSRPPFERAGVPFP